MGRQISLSTYAGFWRRAVAVFIDGIILNIIGVLMVLIFTLIGVMSITSSNPFLIWRMGPLVNIISGVITWLYYAGMESSSKQATIGKIALGIVVVDLEGNPISFGRATGRHFSKIISILILGIGYLMAGFTGKKQALHDMIAGCLVVQRKSYQMAGPISPEFRDVEPPMAKRPEVPEESGELSAASSYDYEKEGTSMREEEPVVIHSDGRDRSFRAVEDRSRTEVIGKPRISAAMAWLIEQAGSDPGRDHKISKEISTIGSAPGNDIVLRDRTVSRRHAEIGISGGKFYVYDMNSTNGTFVNGQLREGRCYLRDGDEIRMGNALLVFKTVEGRKNRA